MWELCNKSLSYSIALILNTDLTHYPRTVHSERELEAESVSYIVCCRNGVKSKAESYLADYVEQNTTVDSIDLYTLLKVAGQIETLLGLAEHTKFK